MKEKNVAFLKKTIIGANNVWILGTQAKGITVNKEGSNQILFVFRNKGIPRLIAKIIFWFYK